MDLVAIYNNKLITVKDAIENAEPIFVNAKESSFILITSLIVNDLNSSTLNMIYKKKVVSGSTRPR